MTRRVAGADVPAFVERHLPPGMAVDPKHVAGADAPAFVERSCRRSTGCVTRRVAGADVPAFVERHLPPGMAVDPKHVAGADAPAFVERARSSASTRTSAIVSPGLMPWPSLSDSSSDSGLNGGWRLSGLRQQVRGRRGRKRTWTYVGGH